MGPHIQIHDVNAHVVDGYGRVRAVRVIGVADRRDRKVLVTLSPGNANGKAPLEGTLDFRASESARWVRPASVGWHSKAEFQLDVHPGVRDPRPAHFWCSELDLTMHPKFPPIQLGLQPVPLWVEAKYLQIGDDYAVTKAVPALPLAKAFPVGVLFVHGIGTQTKSETLTDWTAPLLRWINAWFDAASRCLAERAAPDDVEGWLASLLVHESWESFDKDADVRSSLAQKFAERTFAKNQGSELAALKENFRRSLAMSDLRALEPAEREAATRFAAYVQTQLHSGAISGVAELADARLIDGDAPVTQPSTVEVRVSALTPTGEVERSTWLMAESHWAESFRQPAFAPFGVWCLRVAPIIWVHYFAMIVARSGRPWLRSVGSLLILATVLLVWVVLLIVLFPVLVVPWAPLRAMLLSVQRALAGVVGDSYIFVQDSVQRRAIVDRVRRDVEWMSQRCRQIVVVAHSQGAAVADLAVNNIREYKADSLHALVTLGAGVQVLKQLDKLSGNGAILVTGWTALVGAALFWFGTISAVVSGKPVWGVSILAAVLGLLWSGGRAIKAHPGLRAGPLGAASTKEWLDFFATRDPVPWGPLGTPSPSLKLYQSNEVRNRHSFLTDHTSYWQNFEEVVGPVARLIARAAGFTWLESAVPDVEGVQRWLVLSRRERVQWLRAARMVVVAGTALICIVNRSSLHDIAIWAWSTVGAKFAAGPKAAAVFPGGASVWHTLSMGVPVFLYVTALASIWSAWGSSETRKILRAQASAYAEAWVWMFVIALSAVAFVSVSLARAAWNTEVLAVWAAATAAAGGLVLLIHRRWLKARAMPA